MAITTKNLALHAATAVLALDSVVVPILSGTGQSIHQMVFDVPIPPAEWYVRIAEYVGFLGSSYFAMPETYKELPAAIIFGPHHRQDRDK